MLQYKAYSSRTRKFIYPQKEDNTITCTQCTHMHTTNLEHHAPWQWTSRESLTDPFLCEPYKQAGWGQQLCYNIGLKITPPVAVHEKDSCNIVMQLAQGHTRLHPPGKHTKTNVLPLLVA